jgi:hypothetical protein
MKQFLSLFLLTTFFLIGTRFDTQEKLSIIRVEPVDPSLPSFSYTPMDKSLHYSLTMGILRAKKLDNSWYQCGKLLNKSQWYDKASEMADAVIVSSHFWNEAPVAQLATWQHESRLDPCAIGLYPRKFAIKMGWLRDKPSYTKEEVKYVLKQTRLRSTYEYVDLGLSQLLYPLFTDDADLDMVLSVEGGSYLSSREMARRRIMFRTREPWATWPGRFSEGRKRVINEWVRKMGLELVGQI